VQANIDPTKTANSPGGQPTRYFPLNETIKLTANATLSVAQSQKYWYPKWKQALCWGDGWWTTNVKNGRCIGADGVDSPNGGMFLPGAREGALIGKWGEDGNWFAVGTNYSRTVTAPDGPNVLYLAINDEPGRAYSDNDGAANVQICETPAFAGTGK